MFKSTVSPFSLLQCCLKLIHKRNSMKMDDNKITSSKRVEHRSHKEYLRYGSNST